MTSEHFPDIDAIRREAQKKKVEEAHEATREHAIQVQRYETVMSMIGEFLAKAKELGFQPDCGIGLTASAKTRDTFVSRLFGAPSGPVPVWRADLWRFAKRPFPGDIGFIIKENGAALLDLDDENVSIKRLDPSHITQGGASVDTETIKDALKAMLVDRESKTYPLGVMDYPCFAYETVRDA